MSKRTKGLITAALVICASMILAKKIAYRPRHLIQTTVCDQEEE